MQGLREPAVVAGFALAYLLADLVVALLPDSETIFAAIWPAGGIGLAALLLSPYRRWPWLVLAFSVVGMGADVALAHMSWLSAVGYMTAEMAESLACAVLLIRVSGRSVRFDRVVDVIALGAGAAGIGAVTACIGAGAATLATGESFGAAWLAWWLSDGLSILVIAPLIVTWARAGEKTAGRLRARVIESALFFAAWCALAWFSFNPPEGLALRPYMVIGLLAWPALRLGQEVVSSALVLLAVLAVGDLRLHSGVNALSGNFAEETLVHIQVFVGFAALIGLLLAASYAEVRAAWRASRHDKEQLRTLLETASDGIHVMDMNGNLVQHSRKFLSMLGYDESDAASINMKDWAPQKSWDELLTTMRTVARAPVTFESRHRRKDGSCIDVEISAKGVELDGTTHVYASSRDITARRAAVENLLRSELELRRQRDLIGEQNERLTRQNAELEAALSHLKTLKGILSICMYCKKIHAGNDNWQRIEQYISEHSDAVFSHGMCPECYARAENELMEPSE